MKCVAYMCGLFSIIKQTNASGMNYGDNSGLWTPTGKNILFFMKKQLEYDLVSVIKNRHAVDLGVLYT